MVSSAYMEDKSERVQDLLADWQDSDSNDDDWEEYESVNRFHIDRFYVEKIIVKKVYICLSK